MLIWYTMQSNIHVTMEPYCCFLTNGGHIMHDFLPLLRQPYHCSFLCACRNNSIYLSFLFQSKILLSTSILLVYLIHNVLGCLKYTLLEVQANFLKVFLKLTSQCAGFYFYAVNFHNVLVFWGCQNQMLNWQASHKTGGHKTERLEYQWVVFLLKPLTCTWSLYPCVFT